MGIALYGVWLIKEKGVSFGFETTLAGKKWERTIRELKESNYNIQIFFLDVSSVELSVDRVRYRVESGGHEIPEETIRRRYGRARRNFWQVYKELATDWYLFHNSGKFPEVVAGNSKNALTILDKAYFDFFIKSVEGE